MYRPITNTDAQSIERIFTQRINELADCIATAIKTGDKDLPYLQMQYDSYVEKRNDILNGQIWE